MGGGSGLMGLKWAGELGLGLISGPNITISVTPRIPWLSELVI